MAAKMALLTPRQAEILRLISLGCDSGDIARLLDISPSTVNNHRSNLMRVLAVNKAAILTRLAVKHRVSNLKDKLSAKEKRLIGRSDDGWS
jgi:DNA-binding CsgD family transcriptional regulator